MREPIEAMPGRRVEACLRRSADRGGARKIHGWRMTDWQSQMTDWQSQQ
jgi:hypothetical protein